MPKTLTFVDAVTGATAKAVLLRIDNEEHWCPRSLILDGDTVKFDSVNCDFGNASEEFYIEDWWLVNRGIYQ